MKIVRETLFEEEDYKPKWIKGPTQEQVRARLEANLSGKTLKERFNLAVRNGVVWLLQECIDAGYDPSAYENWAIRLAADHGHPEVVKVLLADPRVDPSAANNFAIRSASQNGHLEVVKALLADKRVNPSVHDNFAIRYASYCNYIEVVKLLLLDPRVDPSAGDNWLIKWASSHEHLELAKELLKDKRVRENLSPELKIEFKEFLK